MDDLNRPLGLPGERKPRGRGLYAGAFAVAAVVLAGGAAAWLLLPAKSGPTATAIVTGPPPGATAPPGVSADTTGSVSADTASGLTEVTPADGLTDIGGGEVVIHNPSDPSPIQLAALPRTDLVENTPEGLLLPRVGPDGTRPLDAYARPSDTSSKNLKIAIVIGGFGIDPQTTTQGIVALPGPVTLAFAPYGDDLAKLTADARAAGHEILLQIPLEPYNYPQTNPGPNTLTAAASTDENLVRLHWLMSRMTNYVGVVNYMGARFTANAKAMGPVISDIGSRGLLYLDDGSSMRSTAAALAGSTTPFLQGDVILDAELTAQAIDARLAHLKDIARERGYAIATASAFPVTIDRVAAFVNAAAGQGIEIVPVSALAARQ